jgi:hypothetical protein
LLIEVWLLTLKLDVICFLNDYDKTSTFKHETIQRRKCGSRKIISMVDASIKLKICNNNTIIQCHSSTI